MARSRSPAASGHATPPPLWRTSAVPVRHDASGAGFWFDRRASATPCVFRFRRTSYSRTWPRPGRRTRASSPSPVSTTRALPGWRVPGSQRRGWRRTWRLDHGPPWSRSSTHTAIWATSCIRTAATSSVAWAWRRRTSSTPRRWPRAACIATRCAWASWSTGCCPARSPAASGREMPRPLWRTSGRSLDEARISHAVCLPIPPNLRFQDLAQAREKDPRIVPFTGVDYTHSQEVRFPDPSAALAADVAAGARGLKLHPIIQKIPLTSPETARRWKPSLPTACRCSSTAASLRTTWEPSGRRKSRATEPSTTPRSWFATSPASASSPGTPACSRWAR